MKGRKLSNLSNTFKCREILKRFDNFRNGACFSFYSYQHCNKVFNPLLLKENRSLIKLSNLFTPQIIEKLEIDLTTLPQIFVLKNQTLKTKCIYSTYLQ